MNKELLYLLGGVVIGALAHKVYINNKLKQHTSLEYYTDSQGEHAKWYFGKMYGGQFIHVLLDNNGIMQYVNGRL